MSLPLEDIIITIDTREQNQKRIKAVETWGKAQGAIVEHSKLDLCDYRILGDFRGNEINIGIEAKSLNDFCSCNYEDLKRKLFDSFELYDEVALFIESANYSFLNEGFGKSAIINPAVRDGSADVCNLAQLEGCCSTLPAYGIHVRQLRSEAQFPFSIENLLTYCIHDHSMVSRNETMSKWEYILTYRNALSRIKGINTKKRLKKIMQAYPNFHFLASASEESLKEVMGKQVGMTIYSVLRYQGLMTEEWRNNKFLDGTDKVLQSQCDPAGKSILKTALSTSPENPADDNDKATKGFFPPKLNPSVAIPNHSSIVASLPETKLLDDTDRDKVTPHSSSKSPGHVQEKDLKLASSIESLKPSPANTLNEDENLFGKTNSDWVPVKGHKMNARAQLEAYLQTPHTLQDCVDQFNEFTSGTIFEHMQRMKKEGVILQFDNGTYIMTKQ